MTVSTEQKAVISEKERSETMIRRIDVCLLLAVLLFTVSFAEAQEGKENLLDRLSGGLGVSAQSSLCTRDAGSRLHRG